MTPSAEAVAKEFIEDNGWLSEPPNNLDAAALIALRERVALALDAFALSRERSVLKAVLIEATNFAGWFPNDAERIVTALRARLPAPDPARPSGVEEEK